MRHRFREGHPVSLVKGRQYEYIRRAIGARDHPRRLLAGENDAPAEAGSGYHPPYRPRGARVTVERADAQQMPVEVAEARQGRSEESMTFAGDQARHAKQRPNRTASRLRKPVRLCRARRDHENALGRDAISRDGSGCSRAGTKHAAKALQRGSLETDKALRRGARHWC